jgi:hypothetical protein
VASSSAWLERATRAVAGDYFELLARQTSGATKMVADELTWFAIEVVE